MIVFDIVFKDEEKKGGERKEGRKEEPKKKPKKSSRLEKIQTKRKKRNEQTKGDCKSITTGRALASNQ